MGSATVKVLSGIPGSGKTKKILKDCKEKDGQKIVLGETHEFLKECQERYEEESSRWKGIKRKCPLKEGNPPADESDEIVTKIIESDNVPSNWACAYVCDKDKCVYKEQFEDYPDVVFAPSNYIFTKYVEDADHLYIDDITYKKESLASLKEAQRFIKTMNGMGVIKEEEVEDLLKKTEEEVYEVCKDCKKYLGRALENKPEKTIENLEIIIPPMTFFEWWKMARLPKYNIDDLPDLPLIFKAFDLAFDRKVTISEANPNMWVLEKLEERYESEARGQVKFEKSSIEQENGFRRNINSVVHRVVSPKYGDIWVPAGSIQKWKKYREVIKERIKKICNTEDTRRIALITKKEIDKEEIVPKGISYESLHFDALRGKNILRNYKYLFVVGTYRIPPDEIPKKFFNYLGYRPETNEVKGEREKGPYKYKDPDLEKFSEIWGKEEMYQSIHRVRPAVNERKIYVFGLVPEKIKEEFKFKKITAEEVAEEKMTYQDERVEDIVVDLIGKEGGEIKWSRLPKMFAENSTTVNNEQWARKRIRKVAGQSERFSLKSVKAKGRGRPRKKAVLT